MHKIEYDIMLNNEGRAYIELPDTYEDKPEDKFLAVELTKYILFNTFNSTLFELDEETKNVVSNTIGLLSQISDGMSDILISGMKNLGNVDLMLVKPYHIIVSSEKELYELPNIIQYNYKLFEKKDGLKILVEDTNQIYIINNGNLEKIDD